MLSTLQHPLSEHVGRADLRLFEAILAHAPSDLDANQTTLHLDKAQVLAALREIEGKDVSPDVVRSRIRHLNAAFIAIGRDVYDLEGAVMTISSRKDSIVLKLSPAAAELTKTNSTLGVLSGLGTMDQVIALAQTGHPASLKFLRDLQTKPLPPLMRGLLKANFPR